MKYPLLLAGTAFSIISASFLEKADANSAVRFHTDLGDIDVLLLEDVAPETVANFLGYVNRHDYDNTFIHRSVANFVIQGGGYRFVNGGVNTVPQQAAVVNEFHVSNTRGTLAMAKLGGNPDSATNQWFFNESDSNAANLDNQNGGFTVFGRIVGISGVATMDAIAAAPVYNAGSPFDQIPLKDYAGGTIQDANLVHVITVREIPVPIIPLLTISRPSGGIARLQITGAPSTSYAVQSSTSVVEGGFSPLVTLTTDASGSVFYDEATSDPHKFYRLTIP